MSETKPVYQSDGLTDIPQHGSKSANNTVSGKEPPAMLLALLNSVLTSMINSQQARIFGSASIRGRRATIIFIFDAEPTTEGLKMSEEL